MRSGPGRFRGRFLFLLFVSRKRKLLSNLVDGITDGVVVGLDSLQPFGSKLYFVGEAVPFASQDIESGYLSHDLLLELGCSYKIVRRFVFVKRSARI